MKIQRHIKFLFDNKLIKLRFIIYDVFAYTIIALFFIISIVYKEKLIDKICSLFPYSPNMVTNAITAWFLFLFCAYLTVKTARLFEDKELAFYKSLGFNSVDILGLKCCNIFFDALFCSAFIVGFFVGSLAIVRFEYFPLYLLLLLFLTTIPVVISSLHNSLKSKRRSANKRSVFVNNMFFRNKYTAYLYKDLCRIKKSSDFIICGIFNITVIIFISLNGNGINIFLFAFLCYFIAYFTSLTTLDFYLIERKDYILYYLSGMSITQLLHHKIFNVSVISCFFVSVYYTVNVVVGNVSFVSTFFSFLCVIAYSFSPILCYNFICVRYFPNEELMKSHAIKFTIFLTLLSVLLAILPIFAIFMIILTIFLWKRMKSDFKRRM